MAPVSGACHGYYAFEMQNTSANGNDTRLPVVCVNCYIKLTFLFGPIRFLVSRWWKLGAASSDILD